MGKEVFTIHINEADTTLARNLAEGIESVQIASALGGLSKIAENMIK